MNKCDVNVTDLEIESPGVDLRITQCNGTTMGATPFCVKTSASQSIAASEKELLLTVKNALEPVDYAMSAYRKDSEVFRFNQSDSTDWFPVSRETAKVVQIALDVSELTGGMFDITAGSLVNRWGFGPEEYSNPPTQEEINELLQSVGYQHLAVRAEPPALRKNVPCLKINLSGIAKGFAVDQVAVALENEGIKNYMIEVGGETRTAGEKSHGNPWTIGIESPTSSLRPGEPQIQCKVRLGAQSMATSGDYYNFIDFGGVRFSHIIDPRTGWPVEKSQMTLTDTRLRLGSLSVVDSSCVRADAMTKGFYVLGIEEGLKFADDNGIAVLFLLREEMPQRDTGPAFTIREEMSDAFKKRVKIVK